MAQPTNTPPGRSNRGFVPAQDLDMPPADGGKITGPGTGTSDSIPDKMQAGTFIMPADSTKALGLKTLRQLANITAIQGNFTPEQAHAAGVAFLTSLRDATHTPVKQEKAEMPVEDDPAQRNFANGGVVPQSAERQMLNSNGTVQGANGQLAAGHSAPVGGGGGSPSIPDSGRPFGFTNPNYWNQMGREDMRKAEAGPGSNLASGTSKLSLSSGGRRFANGGAVQARGFMPAAQRLAGGGVVDDSINPSNFFPYNSPDAGKNIYAGVGFNADAPKPGAQPAGFSYMDNNQSVGQEIKDAWGKGNYGEAAGKTVAGTVGMFSTPLIDGATKAGAAAWDGAAGFGRGMFGMDAQSTAGEAPKPKAAPPASAPTDAPQKTQAKATQVLQQRLANEGRAGMTNADVAQANPNGVVNVKRGANGVMEFSGNNVKGDVSYAGSDGQPLQGGGLRNKGFSTVDVAPAGANVAMGPNGSYAFANAPTGQAAAQTQAPSMAQGFVPGYMQQQGAAPNPMAGMTAEQMLQYRREVGAAQTNARGNQIAEDMRGPKNLRDWNDLRSPAGIAKRNLDFDMKNTPLKGGGRGGGTSIAQQAAAEAYTQLAAKQFKGDGVTDFDRQKYADGQARQQQIDQWSMGKDVNTMAKDERQYQDGAAQRNHEQQVAQLTSLAINPSATPEQRADAIKTLNATQGKGGVQIKAIDLPDQLSPDGNTKMKGGQALVAIHPDGRVQQVNPQPGQGGAKVSSPEQLAALPSGTVYVGPDGKQYRKN